MPTSLQASAKVTYSEYQSAADRSGRALPLREQFPRASMCTPPGYGVPRRAHYSTPMSTAASLAAEPTSYTIRGNITYPGTQFQTIPVALVTEKPTVIVNKLPCAHQWNQGPTSRYAVHHNLIRCAVRHDPGEERWKYIQPPLS